jgi:DNA-binding NarL/FixJ family response regulator
MSSPRALVVEDDPSWQQILSEILADSGLTVDIADNLEDAITHLRGNPHRVAVVDLSLGGIDHRNKDGVSVLDAIRQYDPGCVAIMLTGYATVEIAVSALTEHGAFTCLRKEMFNRSEFRELIQRALAEAAPTGKTSPDLEVEAEPTDIELKKTDEPDQDAPGIALVVDDDAGWRSILSELLEEVGYEVRACNGFADALGYLGRDRLSLAVVDLSLSGEVIPSHTFASDRTHDGYRVLAYTRANSIPTIMVSGIATPDEIEHVYSEYSIFASLQKQTFDRRTFFNTVDEAQQTSNLQGEFADLTAREQQVLGLLIQGLTNKDIADTLYISTNTVKRHLKSIFVKLEVNTRAAAVAKAVNANFSA